MSAIQQLFNDYCPPFKKAQVRRYVGDTMNQFSRSFFEEWLRKNERRLGDTALYEMALKFALMDDAMKGQGWRGYSGDSFTKILIERAYRYWEGRNPESEEIILMGNLAHDLRIRSKAWEETAANKFQRSIGEKPQYAPTAIKRPTSEFSRKLVIAWRVTDANANLGPVGPRLRVRAVWQDSVIREWFLTIEETETARWGDFQPEHMHEPYIIALPFGLNPDSFEMQLRDEDDTMNLVTASYVGNPWNLLTKFPPEGKNARLLAADIVNESFWQDDSVQYLGNWMD